jgi:DDE family transposase
MPAVSSLPEEFALLRTCLTSVSDPRRRRGIRHPLTSVLCLAVLALMAGADSLSAIGRWGSLHPEALSALGLRCSPSVATLSRLLRAVSVAQVRQALLTFTQQLHPGRLAAAQTPPQSPSSPPERGIVAADGKTLRGAWEAGRQLHVLQVFASQSRLILDQVPVRERREEVSATQEWVEQIADRFPGLTVLTGDALLADRSLCAAIVASGRDYLVRVKKTKRTSTKHANSFSPTRRACPI